MKIRNPFFEDPLIAEAAGIKVAIEAMLKAKKARRDITLDEVRALPALAGKSQAAINHALQTLGATFEG